jgi:hypothetical protein
VKRITYRDATVADWPAIQSFHVEQQKLQNTSYELPWLFAPPIILAHVGVDEDGIIRDCYYCEAVAELRVVGIDPKATAFAQRQADGLAYVLRVKGYRYLECFVPRQLKKWISKPLKRARFEDKDSELSYFSRDLR